jgi:uncharacterized SAM-binding protein YcdF (DUF218 family)
MKHDLIICLASQPNPSSWDFPKQLYECLDKAIKLFNNKTTPYIATSGDRSVSLDNRGIVQPFRECDKMADYLINKGISKDKILREGESRDSISNFYYLKKEFLIPEDMKNIAIVVASFRIPRLKFLCERILGNNYSVTFIPIEAEEGETYNEAHTWKVHSLFLESMQPGDHAWLDGKFYDSWMYQYWKDRSQEKYGNPART